MQSPSERVFSRLGMSRSVNLKISLLVILVTTGVLSIFVCLDLFDIQEKKLQDLNANADAAITQLSRVLAGPFWNVDKREVDTILSAAMRDPNIQSICLFDRDEERVFAGMTRTVDWKPVATTTPLSDGDIVREANFVSGATNYGRIRLAVSERSLRQELRQVALRQAGRVVVLELFLVGALLFCLRLLFIRPILRLCALAKAVSGEKRFDLRAEKSSPDEIGGLVDAINEMLEHIEESDRQLRAYSSHLEDMVGQRTSELEEKNAQLSQAMADAQMANQAKSDFLANMSHEIRTPMNAVIGMTDIALSTTLTSKQREYLTIIRSSSHLLLELLNDILDFSKIEAGKLGIEAIPFTLRDILDQISDLFREKTTQTGLELILSLAPGIPAVLRGDPLRLRQILVNLVSNAFKFTQQGQIVLHIEMTSRTPETVSLTFSVCDSGIGIPKAFLDTMFSPFTQADQSITRHYGGTGLGLAICKRLTELMGGRIWVESQEGHGSSFLFNLDLPVIAEAAGERRPACVPPGLSILVVDDNPMALLVIQTMLEGFGLRAAVAASGQEALDKLRDPDGPRAELLLADWKMPGMDGLELVRRIREDADLSALPVIMMTAFGREDVHDEAQKLGTCGMLVKPVKASALLDALMQALGLARMTAPALDEKTAGENDFPGARLLVAEDNLVNQQVISTMLAGAGFAHDVVGNGLQALSALSKNTYDVVLMDVQMPEMDGLEATRAIRANPALAGLPVIAMTAHALSGDKEKCLVAGMSDYVTKPLDRKKLFAALRRFLAARPAQSPVACLVPTAAAPGPEIAPDALPGVDLAEGLARLGGDRKGYQRAFGHFLEGFRHVVVQLKTALAAGDDAEVRRVLHSLTGAAGNLSAVAISRTAAALDAALGPGNGDGEGEGDALPGLLARLEEQFAALGAAAAVAFPGPLPGPAGVWDGPGQSDLAGVLVALAESLDFCEPLGAARGVADLKTLALTRGAGHACDCALARLEEQVGEYRFAEATSTLAQLRQLLSGDGFREAAS